MNDEKRKEAKRRADRLRAEYEEKQKPLEWFEALYKEADGDPELIPWGGKKSAANSSEKNPWAHGQARLPLLEWLKRPEHEEWMKGVNKKRLALDVGCGLGANAIALQNAGYQVTAFDISETAVKWAAENAKDLPIEWRTENLLNMPKDWHGKFDLVSETFTIQALYGEERQAAIKALTELVAPNGKLLIICRGRPDDKIPEHPPLPLSPAELEKVEEFGFSSTYRKEFFDNKTPANLHFAAEFTKV